MKKIFFLSIIALAGFSANAQDIKQTDITSINNSLNTVLKLNPINFSYDKNWAGKLKLNTQKQTGFAIQEVEKFAPELIVNQKKSYTVGKNATKTATVSTVDYETLIPLLVGSIKEQQQQIEDLKQEVKLLKAAKSK